MKNFFKHPVTIAVIIILVIVAFYFGYQWYSNKGLPKASGGTAPTDEDKNCAGGNPAGKMIAGSCTKPKVFPAPPGIKEKCFTSEQLGLNEGDSGYAIVTDNNGFGKKWYFNYQSGDRFCYTDKQF